MGMLDINGVQLDFNLYDADLVERYEEANDKLIEKISNDQNFAGLRLHENIRLQCQIVDDFFDSTFGEGTAEKLFKGKADLKMHSEAFSIVVAETKKFESKVLEENRKYSPNRVDRRAQMKGHRGKGNKPRPTVNKQRYANTGDEHANES